MTDDGETIWVHSTGLSNRQTKFEQAGQLIDRPIWADRFLGVVSRGTAGSNQALSCQRGGFLAQEDITACAFERDSKLISP